MMPPGQSAVAKGRMKLNPPFVGFTVAAIIAVVAAILQSLFASRASSLLSAHGNVHPPQYFVERGHSDTCGVVMLLSGLMAVLCLLAYFRSRRNSGAKHHSNDADNR